MAEWLDRLPDWSVGVVFALAGLLLAVLVVLVVARLRRRRGLPAALRRISFEMLTDIVVPKADEGEIQIQYTLLTGRGVLVLDVKEVEGVVFASDRMDDWTVMAGDRRYTFANPQPSLYDRVAAVTQIVRDVPVEGHILFPAAADFSKGRPRHVARIEDLLDKYPDLDREGRDRAVIAAFLPHWQRLQDAAVGARVESLAQR